MPGSRSTVRSGPISGGFQESFKNSHFAIGLTTLPLTNAISGRRLEVSSVSGFSMRSATRSLTDARIRTCDLIDQLLGTGLSNSLRIICGPKGRLVPKNASAFRDMPFPNYWSLADFRVVIGLSEPIGDLALIDCAPTAATSGRPLTCNRPDEDTNCSRTAAQLEEGTRSSHFELSGDSKR